MDIEEIDYAAVLKERDSGDDATWDNVLEACLKGESVELDDSVIEMLLTSLGDAGSFGALLDRLQEKADSDGASVSAQVAALLQLLKAALAAVADRETPTREQILETVAESTPHLSPDMILGLMAQRESARPEDAAGRDGHPRSDDGRNDCVVRCAIGRLKDAAPRRGWRRPSKRWCRTNPARASCWRWRTTRPSPGSWARTANFEGIWQDAAKTMLTTYSDEGFVSADYARELTAARTQAIEVERTSDDPPERIAEWLRTVSEPALHDLDLEPHAGPDAHRGRRRVLGSRSGRWPRARSSAVS